MWRCETRRLCDLNSNVSNSGNVRFDLKCKRRVWISSDASRLIKIRSESSLLPTIFYTAVFQRESAAYSHNLPFFFSMLVFHLNCPSLSTLRVSGGEVFVLYLFRVRSYYRETPEGDLHALEQPRADQIHFSVQEHHAHTHAEELVWLK